MDGILDQIFLFSALFYLKQSVLCIYFIWIAAIFCNFIAMVVMHFNFNEIYLCLLFRQFHVVKYPEQDLEQVSPPVGLERISIGFDYLEEHCQRSRSHIKFTPGQENSVRFPNQNQFSALTC